MKSGAVCKTPFAGFTRAMFSSRGKWEREACGRDKEDPYSQEWVLGINNGSPEGSWSWILGQTEQSTCSSAQQPLPVQFISAPKLLR